MDPVSIFSLVILGLAVGFLAGLLGIGGGMILVPFMTMLFPLFSVPQELVVHAAIATSMATIVFTSVSSMRAHHKKGAVRWNIVSVMGPGMIVGGLLSGGAVFAFVSGVWLSVIFAIFVGYSALKMLSKKPPKVSRTMPGTAATAGVGVGIGFVSGLLGAGGAFLSVPFMMRGNVPIHHAVATSAALGFFIAVANSAGYIYSGFEAAQGQQGMLGYIYWPALLVVSAMSVVIAPLGARCAHALPVASLRRAFSVLLLSLAAYMIFEAYIRYTA